MKLNKETRLRVFGEMVRQARLPAPVAEFPFAKGIGRKWRMDFCWVEQKVGLEVDGGIWHSGRHTRGAGWLKDSEKLNQAAVMGYRMLRCTPDQLTDPQLITTIREALNG